MRSRMFRYWLVLCLVFIFRKSTGEPTGKPDCLAPHRNTCREEDEIGGRLLLDCSGRDYIVTIEEDYPLSTLSLFAECSSPCGDGESMYYYDTTGLLVSQIRAMNKTINGTSGLGMPLTLGSNCTVFGCYYSSRGGNNKFTSDSCSGELPVETTMLETSSSEIPPANNQSTSVGDLSSTPESSSTEDSRNSLASASTMMKVGTPMSVVLFALIAAVLLLLVGLCYHHHHKNKSNKAQLYYSEEMFDSSNSSDDFKVYEEGIKIFGLVPAVSQVSVFNSFSKFAVDTEKSVNLKTDLEHSYSLSSDYFEAEDNDTSKFTDASTIKKMDLSDTLSAGGESELTEDMTQEEEDIIETDSEPSQGLVNTANCPSPRTPCCSTPVGSGSTSGHRETTPQNARQQSPSSSVHNMGVFDVASPMEIPPVGSGYVSTIGTELHNTNELQSVTATPHYARNTISVTSSQSSSFSGSDYLPSDNVCNYVPNANESTPMSSSAFQTLRSHYLQGGSQPSQNVSGNIELGNPTPRSHSAWQPHVNDRTDHNDGPRSSQLQVASELSGSDYIPCCSEVVGPAISTTCSVTAESTQIEINGGYIPSNDSTGAAAAAAGDSQFEEEDNKSDIIFIEEYSPQDEAADICESSASSLRHNASSCRQDWENRTKHEPAPSSCQTTSLVSLSLEPADHFSEANEDLDGFAEYINEGRDKKINPMGQPDTLKDGTKCNSEEGYFSGGFSTDSIQFDFPCQQTGLERIEGIARSTLLDQNQDNSRNPFDNAAADVSDVVFGYSDLLSTFSSDFQADTPDLASPKTTSSFLLGISTRTLDTSTEENLNIISYDFDGQVKEEDETEEEYARGDQSVISIPFSHAQNNLQTVYIPYSDLKCRQAATPPVKILPNRTSASIFTF